MPSDFAIRRMRFVPRFRLRGRASLVVGAVVFIIFLIVGVIGPFITPYDPNEVDISKSLARVPRSSARNRRARS